jgi:hypothetical protein
MRKGYRDSDENFNINSEVDQFNFKLKHNHLKVDIDWDISPLASIERINIYLSDYRVFQNIFVVNESLWYYYEKDWYYDNKDIREEVPVPKENVLKHFNFRVEDILLIEANNVPQPAEFDFFYWLAPFKPNILDSKKSIELNILVKENVWQELPKNNSNIIYLKAV